MKILLPDDMDLGADPIASLLKRHHTIGVVGLSSDPGRPSYGVARYMQSAGYRIIPVNPNEREVLGEKSYAHLDGIPEQIEIVNIFRRAEQVSPAVEGAIRIGAKVVWMQVGIEHQAAAEKARAAGLIVVMDACIFVEHNRRRQSLGR
jgi:predicted CoA-binding protein